MCFIWWEPTCTCSNKLIEDRIETYLHNSTATLCIDYYELLSISNTFINKLQNELLFIMNVHQTYVMCALKCSDQNTSPHLHGAHDTNEQNYSIPIHKLISLLLNIYVWTVTVRTIEHWHKCSIHFRAKYYSIQFTSVNSPFLKLYRVFPLFVLILS